MFNFHNRQFIFRQTTGELWNFFCDSGQNICYNTLTNTGVWSNVFVLHKNVYRHFYAEIDQDDVYHILFQDIKGNINYSRLDGQSTKTISVLNSRTPSAYDKQLYLAPLSGSLYFFYVLQHDNSFMLAYQILDDLRMSTPKVVDYVSGSSQPCSIVYDRGQNIYAFYQSYDGKYLQIGYKKLNAAQKHWSDFIPVTKYAGNCEYPHALVDSSGVIHLCYQRRTPRLFEMVYQQKAPDRNLWSAETVIHSSVHSFENASILQVQDNIIVYWVRENIVYYNSGAQDGSNWGKASRYGNQPGSQLLCLCYKSNSPRDRIKGDASLVGDGSLRGDGSSLSPGVYPGSLSNGLRLLFLSGDGSLRGGASSLFSVNSSNANIPERNLNRFVADTLLQLQGSVEEIREGWTEARREMSQLTNAYLELKKEIDKYSIQLGMVKNQLDQNKRQLNQDKRLTRGREIIMCKEEAKQKLVSQKESLPHDSINENTTSEDSIKEDTIKEDVINEDTKAEDIIVEDIIKETPKEENPPPGSTLDPEKLQEWENWEEPKQWQGAEE